MREKVRKLRVRLSQQDGGLTPVASQPRRRREIRRDPLCRECPSDLERAHVTASKVSIGFLPHMWLSHQIADRLIGHLLQSNH